MGCRCFRGSEERWLAGEQNELLLDPQAVVVEVDALVGQAEALAWRSPVPAARTTSAR